MEERAYINGKGEEHTGLVHYIDFRPKIRGLVTRFVKNHTSLKSFLNANLI